MKQKVKAVFFDIDGTLLSFNTHKISRKSIDAIAALRAKGIKVFIATGRMVPMLDVLEDIDFDGFITCNGAYCIDGTGNVIFSNPIPKIELEKMLDYLDENAFPASFMKRDEMTVNVLDEKVVEVANIVGLVPPRVENPRKTIENDVYQVCIYIDDERVDYLMNSVFTKCSLSRWSPIFADINLSSNSKQTGVDNILDYYGIDLSETLAFGDGENDIPMLKHVAAGVAMGNASERVKSVADYVTDSVEDEGVANALEKFGIL